MSLKAKPNQYEIAFSARKDPNSWNSVVVDEGEVLLKLAEIVSKKDIQLECVTLIASSHKNRYDLPLPD